MLTRRNFTRTGLAVLGGLAIPRPQCTPAVDLPAGLETIPPDLPLPNSGPSHTEWIRQAVILQPWGNTQYIALTSLGDRPRRLQEELGLNAIIVLPTQAHNALCDFIEQPQAHLTDAQFREGVDAYKKVGCRLILYSSVMHCGHAPVWQTGQLGQEHPDWLQRDAWGTPITRFGNASWLCGSSPARDYTLDYTLQLVKDYSADGIMLDNNGFGHTEKGWTCYCDYCQQGFRKYALARCGADWISSQLQTTPQDLRIPTSPGPHFALWAHWRNRVWAEINELFRPRLRMINPQILFFGNTQYDLPVNTQAASLQFRHEDILFSETHEVDPWYISQKMVLGQGLAAGLPLWDYMGTFAEAPQGVVLDKLRPPELLRRTIPASLAHGARPWIVQLGFEDPESRPSMREMGRYLSWFVSHPDLFVGSLNTPVAALISLRARDVLARVGNCVGQGVVGCYPELPAQQPLTPPHILALLRAGVPVVALPEFRLSSATLRPFRIFTLESGAVMTKNEADVIAGWVRAGGLLITVPDAGGYDELGRKLDRPLLLETLGLHPNTAGPQKFGKGRVLVADPVRFTDAVLAAVKSSGIPFTLPAGIEVVCYQSQSRHIIHLLPYDAGSDAASLRFPSWLGARPGPAQWFSPDWSGSRALAIERKEGSTVLQFPELPPYSVIAFSR